MFKKSELKFWRNRKINELHDKRINRKRLKFQKKLKFIKKIALLEITVKRQKKKILKKNESKIISWKCDEWKKMIYTSKKSLLKKQKKFASNK